MIVPYTIIPAQQEQVPVIISVPHCGIQFPSELKDRYKEELIKAPSDTDWFVDRLYDFAPAMGITMITANYSRWVIDLNRDPESKPLYTDGRIITGLCPSTNFLGESIYRDNRKEIDSIEIKRRLDQFYWPYHLKLSELLESTKNKFGKVLLWDCHSIRQFVPTIHKEKFPDLILGDADGTSASPGLIETALNALETLGHQVSHNYPFKGGYITRHNGRPGDNFHALQLEMTKVNYMDDDEMKYDTGRAEKMRLILAKVFEGLIEQMGMQ
jgi:N-formylglutamate deformylase